LGLTDEGRELRLEGTVRSNCFRSPPAHSDLSTYGSRPRSRSRKRRHHLGPEVLDRAHQDVARAWGCLQAQSKAGIGRNPGVAAGNHSITTQVQRPTHCLLRAPLTTPCRRASTSSII